MDVDFVSFARLPRACHRPRTPREPVCSHRFCFRNYPMQRFFPVLLAALALAPTPALAQEPIRLARTPDISPDGKLVAFSYLGDIWVVEAIGGKARPVTMHRAHEINPVFSPDGHFIAF